MIALSPCPERYFERGRTREVYISMEGSPIGYLKRLPPIPTHITFKERMGRVFRTEQRGLAGPVRVPTLWSKGRTSTNGLSLLLADQMPKELTLNTMCFRRVSF